MEIARRDNSFQKLCFQGKTGGEWARAIFFFFFFLIQSGFGIRTCSRAGGNKAIEARAAGVVSVRSAGAGRERRPRASLPRRQISQRGVQGAHADPLLPKAPLVLLPGPPAPQRACPRLPLSHTQLDSPLPERETGTGRWKLVASTLWTRGLEELTAVQEMEVPA